jgi:hypothetical protein
MTINIIEILSVLYYFLLFIFMYLHFFLYFYHVIIILLTQYMCLYRLLFTLIFFYIYIGNMFYKENMQPLSPSITSWRIHDIICK